MSKTGMKWYGQEVKKEVRRKSLLGSPMQRLTMAVIMLANHAKENLVKRESDRPRTLGSQTKKMGSSDTGTVSGAIANAVGEYPAKMFGHLSRNVIHVEDEAEFSARWGTNVIYGKHLALARKRKRRYPWMQMTNRALMGRVRRLLGGRL